MMSWPVLALAVCPLLPAQEVTGTAEKASVELKELEARFQEVYDQWVKDYLAANEAEDQELLAKLVEQQPQGGFAAEFLEAGKRYAGTDAAVPFLLWAVNNSYSSPAGKEALETLLRDHSESAELAKIVRVIPYADREKAGEILAALAEHSPHAEVQAQALFTRSDMLLQGETTDAQRQGAIADLHKVIEVTGDASLKTRAEGAIFEAENLAVGLVAPDIEAEDLDGVKFKLSDYRGKVILLDFWGDW